MRDRNYLALGDPAPLAAALGPSDYQALRDRIIQVEIDQQLSWIDQIAEFEHPLFHVQYGPVAPQWCSDKLLERIAQASAATGRRVHMHLFETQRQRQWADASYPEGLVRRLDEIGLLSERLTVAHGVWLRRDECELLAERGVTVSVNTSSNLRLRSGVAPIAVFQAAQLSWALGLDGMAFDGRKRRRPDDEQLAPVRGADARRAGGELLARVDPHGRQPAPFGIARDEHVGHTSDSLEIDDAASAVIGHRDSAEAHDVLAGPVDRHGREDHRAGVLGRQAQYERREDEDERNSPQSPRHCARSRSI